MAAAAPTVFVDSSAWVALLYRRDQAHPRAVARWRELAQRRAQPVTTNLVVAETHAFLRRRLGFVAAAAFLDRALDGLSSTIVWADRELTEAAVDGWLRRFRDQPFSLTDAVSFAAMHAEGIGEAFTFDDDFERAGFRVLK